MKTSSETPTVAASSAAPFVPDSTHLHALAQAAKECRGCELYRPATQTVFGEGPRTARVVMLGEQPGDQEDREGKPFVGPAGKLLDRALAEAGILRKEVYISNVVKHFRFTWEHRRRFHKKPSARHIRACRPWLEAEIRAIHPIAIVCLGASAAQSLLRRAVTISKERGRVINHEWGKLFVTAHPSSILRIPEEVGRRESYGALVADLKLVKKEMA